MTVLALSAKGAKGILWLLDDLANSFFKLWSNNVVGGRGNQKIQKGKIEWSKNKLGHFTNVFPSWTGYVSWRFQNHFLQSFDMADMDFLGRVSTVRFRRSLGELAGSNGNGRAHGLI